MPTFIQTYDGGFVDIEDLHPEEVSLDDIAIPLSRIARFNGHTKSFYSVAQHSVLVAQIATELMAELMKEVAPDTVRCHWIFMAARWGLLHDAHEAYIGDIASPLSPLAEGLVKLKPVLDKAIAQKFGIPIGYWDPHRQVTLRQGPDFEVNVHQMVKKADAIALATEKRDLMAHNIQWPGTLEEPRKEVVSPVDSATAYTMFTRSCQHLLWNFANAKDPAFCLRDAIEFSKRQ